MDGLRALAVGVVYVFHATQRLSPGGFIGVDIFFVISGFLITALLLKEWNKYSSINFKNFYIRRALRLLPALFFMLTMYLIATQTFWRGVVPGATEQAWGDVMIVLFYISNWTRALGFERPNVLGHAWSLSTEEQFYMLWPPIMLLLLRYVRTPKRMALAAFAGGLLIALYRYILVIQGASIERLSTGLDTRLDGILMGCGLGVLYVSGLLPKSLKFQKFANVLAAISVMVLVILNFTVGYKDRESYMYWLLLANLATLAILLQLAVVDKSWLKRILELPPLIYLGKISYGFYLYHMPLLTFLGALGFRDWTRIAIIGPLTLIISMLSYKYLETPFLNLKDKFIAAPIPHHPSPVIVPKQETMSGMD
ncbi:MAG: hypothetical protein Fur0022_21790 [Anaerolineales bacterium]